MAPTRIFSAKEFPQFCYTQLLHCIFVLSRLKHFLVLPTSPEFKENLTGIIAISLNKSAKSAKDFSKEINGYPGKCTRSFQ